MLLFSAISRIELSSYMADSKFEGLFVPRGDTTFNSRRIYNPILSMQYILNQIGLDNVENGLLLDVARLMEKYHIENYKRMGMPYPIKQIIASIE